MPRVRFALSLALLLATGRMAFAQPNPKQASDESPLREAADRSADEQAIRANVNAFVRAYNDHDARAIAELFTPEGQIITATGETSEGRQAIASSFQEHFTAYPSTKIEVHIESIRLLGSSLAVEVGSTKETPAPGETPHYGRYTVLHVKHGGGWLMAAARDNPGEPPTPHERLLPLAWLVGEWIDEEGSTVVHTTCRWSEDRHFLLQEIHYQVAGKDTMRVTQRIGWDPLAKRIRSWAFDALGGFSEGVWVRDGDSWVVKSNGVRPDGAAGSSTSVLIPTGPDGYVLRVRDRVVGDVVEPPVEVRVVRKPPTPNVSGARTQPASP